MSKVWTPSGYQNGPVNSIVGKGETIFNPASERATYVDRGTVGVDNQPSSVSENDDNVILGNDTDWLTGKTFAEQAESHTKAIEQINKTYDKIKSVGNKSSLNKQTLQFQQKQLEPQLQQHSDMLRQLSERQQRQHKIEEFSKNARHGSLLPHYFDGKSLMRPEDQIIGMGIPAANALAQGIYWGTQPIEQTSTYRVNPYSNKALSILSGLRANPTQQVNEANNMLRQSIYSNQNAGGLTGAQRNQNRIALGLGSMQNAAKIYGSANELNNQYRSAYAGSLMQAGESARQAMMNAAMNDRDNYQRAHAARIKGIETAMANMNNIAQTYAQDKFKVRMADNTLSLYLQQLDDDKRKAYSKLIG